MNYDLALKLKEAGFNQNRRDDVKYFCGPEVVMTFKEAKYLRSEYHPVWDSIIINYQKTLTAVPSLSELIEACGSICLWKYKDSWNAGLLEKEDEELGFIGSKYVDNTWNGNIGEGSTPEEAVANLWLELNKK